MKVTIADNLFLHHSKSAYSPIPPKDFEWEPGDPDTARFVTDSMIKFAKGPGQVAWLMEPFFLHTENYMEAMSKPFDAVITHDRYFSTHVPGWIFCPHGGSHIAPENWGMREKTRNISILATQKTSMRGHQLRREIVEEFSEVMDDVFGIDRMVPAIDAYAPYRFSIIVENEKAPGYFTERLIDCLAVGTIPIYWGASDIDDFFACESVFQFTDMMGLRTILDKLWNNCKSVYRLSWPFAEINCHIAKNYVVCEDHIFAAYPNLFGG